MCGCVYFPSDLKEKLEEKIPTKTPKDPEKLRLIANIQDVLLKLPRLTAKKGYEYALKQLGDECPKPKTLKMSKILSDLHLDNRLRRYTELNFQPWCRQEEDPTGIDTLNTWNGFYLDQYEPTKKLRIKETRLWEYFKDVWGHGSTESSQFRYMLDLLAFFVQYPAIRTERLYLLVSEEQGTGKSIFFKVLQMLFRGYCNYHDAIESYIGRFNSSDNSKLCIWIDDIYGATLNQTRKLFPKASCGVQRYENRLYN